MSQFEPFMGTYDARQVTLPMKEGNNWYQYERYVRNNGNGTYSQYVIVHSYTNDPYGTYRAQVPGDIDPEVFREYLENNTALGTVVAALGLDLKGELLNAVAFAYARTVDGISLPSAYSQNYEEFYFEKQNVTEWLAVANMWSPLGREGYYFPTRILAPDYQRPVLGSLLELIASAIPGRIPGTPLKPGIECFPAEVAVKLADGSEKPICGLVIGEQVLAFGVDGERGRGGLVPKRVTRLYRNITTEWITLSWTGGRGARELTATPGHHFLDESGNFSTIAEMLERGGGKARIVLEDGSLAEVTGRRIVYSDETAHLFEQAEEVRYRSVGGLALTPEIVKGWRTYNFEVEDTHTYVAGGVRVHNISELYAHNGIGVDDYGFVAVAYAGGGVIPINSGALNSYYNAYGGADGFAGTAIGYSTVSMFATYDTYGSFSQTAAVYSAALREMGIEPGRGKDSP